MFYLVLFKSNSSSKSEIIFYKSVIQLNVLTTELYQYYHFQALNYMARGMGLPPLPHPHGGHPLAGHPAGLNGAPHMTPHHVMTSNAGGVIGRPTSTPSTGTSAFNGKFMN